MSQIDPLSISPILKSVLGYGGGEYIFIGGVSKHWRREYISLFGEEYGKKTMISAASQSFERLQLALRVDLNFINPLYVIYTTHSEDILLRVMYKHFP
jgi:hypothetical protein